MRKSFNLLLLNLVFLLVTLPPSQQLPSSSSSPSFLVVPLPLSWATNPPPASPPAFLRLSPTLSLAGNGSAVPTLVAAFGRFLAQSLPQYRDGGASGGEGCGSSQDPSSIVASVSLSVTVNASEAHPQLGDDESYALTLAPEGSPVVLAVTCPRIWGCIHALTTLGQLVQYNVTAGGGGGCYCLPALLPPASPTVVDAPRYSHRGVLVDVARHFYPLPTLLLLLDGMAACKLNVLHIHLTDDQSFPLVFPSTAHFSSPAGAFSPTKIYSAGDLAALVEAARLRGIRVVPEVDSPGHAASWCAGTPGACVACRNPSPSAPSALDPSSNQTLPLVGALLAALRATFPDRFVHLGGDEIDLNCWLADPALAAWLAAKYPSLSPMDAARAEAYGSYIPAVDALAAQVGYADRIHWEDAFDFAGASPLCGGVTPRLSVDTVVEVFRNGFGPVRPARGVCGSTTVVTTWAAVNAGYRVIWTPPSAWYLSCYADTCDQDGGGAGWQPFASVYEEVDPAANLTDPALQALVIGGEATVWSERLDAATLLAVAFPRASAVAERLWSPLAPGVVGNATAALPRFLAHREYLLARGVPASSVGGGNEASAWGLPSRPSGPGTP
jgi:hexosaminidase